MKTFLAAGLMALLVSTAQAQQLAPEFRKCLDVAVTNYEFSACSSAEIKRQEQLLTAAWAKVSGAMKNAGGNSEGLLLKEQRAWIVYKDASCQFYTEQEAFGREGTVIHFGVCRVKVIASRVKELNDLAEDLFKPR